MRPYKGVLYELIHKKPPMSGKEVEALAKWYTSRTEQKIDKETGVVFVNFRKVPRLTANGTQAQKDISRIERQGDKITVSLMDENDVLYSRGTFELDGKNFGCVEGLLMIKSFKNHLNPEGGYQSLMYSETIVYNGENRSLNVTDVITDKDRRLTGSFGTPKRTIRTWNFERVEK
ncbi:hypothetical protein FACS1894158_17930 [Betaproteobacteria bacterium]|nr:hypothetical protein FACS1894158_17930 [Betaproteobacteria bacterium]